MAVEVSKSVRLQFYLLLGFVALSLADGLGGSKSTGASDGQGNLQMQAAPQRDRSQVAGVGGGGTREGRPLKTQVQKRLGDDPGCIEHIRKYCRNQSPNIIHNLAALDCLQNNVPKDEELSDECQHSIWMVKKSLSDDMRFESAAGAVCQNDLQKIKECDNLGPRKGFKIPCLVDHIENITSPSCKDFLMKMEAIVFSDYRLVYKFVDSCQQDINNLRCGRLEDDEDDDKAKKSIHNQGDTIACLQGNLSSLNQDCKRQILRVAELQGNDYHSDRQLFFACQDDREKLCPYSQSGGGRVYQCLAAHKFDPRMSLNCRARLTVRQQMERADYKVNRGFTVACKIDIMNERCVERLQQTQSYGLQEARLSIILLCLENATKSGRKLDPKCTAELTNARKSLMSDYKLSPEIVSSCGLEIKDRCKNGLERDGKTIHCLMSLTRNQNQAKSQSKDVKPVSNGCQKALGILMKEVDVRENFDIDPVLQAACGSIARLKCSSVQAGQGKVIDCLMDFVDRKDIMNDECKDRLMETQYFVSRDFSLSPGFYRACRSTMASSCSSTPEKLNDEKSEAQSNILLCLWRNRDKNRVARACVDAVKQVMIDRAKSVDLEPAVEAACMNDLSIFCSEKTKKKKVPTATLR